MIYEVTMYAAKCDNCDKDEEWEIVHNHPEEVKHYCPDCFCGFDDDDNLLLKEIKR